jgi:hypothetical protein
LQKASSRRILGALEASVTKSLVVLLAARLPGRALAIVAMFILPAPAVLAHHGYDDFFRDKHVTIEGVIEDVVYANPHVTLKIRNDDARLYTVLWRGVNQVWRLGAESTDFKVGDRVRVTGSPPRDPASLQIALVRQVTRMSDGRTWGSQ